MAELLSDMRSFILANVDTTGYSIFEDTMLDEPDNAIAIYEYAGVSPIPQIESTLRSLQIVSRSKSSLAAKQMANSIVAVLRPEDGILDLTTERWCQIVVRQAPFKLKVDPSGRTYYVFNVGLNTYYD